MDINDYLKIAKEYAKKHYESDDFIIMGLHKLIQDTDLFKLHAHALLSQQGDDGFGLIVPQSNPLGSGYRSLVKIVSNDTFSVDVDNSTIFMDNLFGFEKDHELITRFQDDLQNSESLFDLKDVYTFDEIVRIKHLIMPSTSMGLALDIISQNNESFEAGMYNDGQYSYPIKINMAEDINYGKSMKFDFFSQDPLYELMMIKEFPLTPERFFKELNVTAQSKIITISGFDHISFIEEDFQDMLDNGSPFMDETFVGSLFKLDSLRDIMIAYFDHQEFDDIKFEFGLRAEKFFEQPTIEHLLANDNRFTNVNDMLMEVYAKHPEISYSIQDIQIIKDKEILDKNEVLEHQIDKFHLFENHRGIQDLGPSMNDRKSFMNKYKLYGDDILKLDSDKIRFISSNQFSADAIIAAKQYNDTDYHKELSIDSLAINPQLSDEHITELLKSVVDYAKENKQVIMLTMQKDSPWGGINKERFISLVNNVIEEHKNDVPFVCDFGKNQSRYHLARSYLVDKSTPYEDLPKLLGKIKAFIDVSTDLDDLQTELELDKFVAKEKMAQKNGLKAQI